MPFMGWSVERGRNGEWYAVKVLSSDGYGATNVQRVRHHMKHLSRNSTLQEAEREILRLYRRKILQ